MIRPFSLRLFVAATLLFAAGCRREQIRVYTAPADAVAAKKAAHNPNDGPDPSADPHGSDPHGSDPHAAPGQPVAAQIGWQLPDGWREASASEGRFAAFTVPSSTGGKADVAISQFGNLEHQQPFLVNMWREQVTLGPLPEAEAAKAFSPATVAGQPGLTFEVVGTREGKPVRILTAILHRGKSSWFFKLAGDEPTVLENKDKFLEFVKTIRFTGEDAAPEPPSDPAPAPSAPSAPSAPAPALASPNTPMPPLKWTVPEGWTALTPGQMQVGKFSVPEQNGAKADVSVSIFPSDTGGNLANVNRWRAQLGLPPTDDAGLASSTTLLDGGGTLIDLTNEQRQLVGAIIPRKGQWWFYKMLGDAPAVTAAKDAFVQFAKTAP